MDDWKCRFEFNINDKDELAIGIVSPEEYI